MIGGALTWINRHGGCARRSNKRSADFEDFGLADTDFPHHRSPAMQSALVTNAAGTPMMSSTTPTIPRLNDQGNFYGAQQQEYNQAAGYAAYQPQLEQSNNEYNTQPYYYQPPLQQEAAPAPNGYYDESGYYYDGSNTTQHPQQVSNATYDPQLQQQQQQFHPQQGYIADNSMMHSYPDHQTTYTTPTSAMTGDHHYKPDQVDITPHRHI